MQDSAVDRAEKMYPPGAPLPPLNATSSDEAIAITILRQGGGAVVAHYQREALGAFQKLLGLNFVPRHRVQSYFVAYEDRVRHAIAIGGLGERTPGWWIAAIFALRSAIETRDWLVVETIKLAGLEQGAAQRAMIDDGAQHAQKLAAVTEAHIMAGHAARLAATTTSVTPASIIASFAVRGIQLSISASGAVCATGASLLTDADRVQIANSKAAIVAALSNVLEIA